MKSATGLSKFQKGKGKKNKNISIIFEGWAKVAKQLFLFGRKCRWKVVIITQVLNPQWRMASKWKAHTIVKTDRVTVVIALPLRQRFFFFFFHPFYWLPPKLLLFSRPGGFSTGWPRAITFGCVSITFIFKEFASLCRCTWFDERNPVFFFPSSWRNNVLSTFMKSLQSWLFQLAVQLFCFSRDNLLWVF